MDDKQPIDRVKIEVSSKEGTIITEFIREEKIMDLNEIPFFKDLMNSFYKSI